MDPELQSFISNYLYLADIRNVDKTNPITFELEPDHRQFLMVCSYDEPTFSQLPYNVLWLVYNPEDAWFEKVYRRVSHTDADGRKNTWEEITSFAMLFDTDQYYQAVSDVNPFDLGIEGEFSLTAATTLKAGLVLIPNDVGEDDPVVVTLNYPGFLGARTPTEHTHPDAPRTMVHIDGAYTRDEDIEDKVGDTDTFVSFDYASIPEAGDLFFLTENNPLRTNEWFGEWRKPTSADVVTVVPNLIAVDVRISGSATEFGDNATGQLEADGVFDDNTRDINPAALVWSIEPNSDGITVDQSGLVTIPDINADTTITVYADLEDKYHAGTIIRGLIVINVKDLYTPVIPQSLAIIGNATQNEETTGSYLFRVSYSDGSTNDITPDNAASSEVIATFGTNGDLTALDIATDTPTVLSASATVDGVLLTATLPVTIIAEIVPVSLDINGQASVKENGVYTYTFVVNYSDGSSSGLAVSEGATSTNTSAATFATNGELTANDVTEDTAITIGATATVDGVLLTGSLAVNVVADAVPSGIEILGADTMNEGDTESYTFRVTYSDSSTIMVAVGDLDSFVSDNSDATLAGADLTLGSINADGTVTLTATYTELGATVTDTHDVSLVADPVPQTLTILGATTTGEGSVESYTFRVTMTDASTKMVTVGDFASDDPNAVVSGSDVTIGSITADGAANLSASYTEDGITVADTHVLGYVADPAPQSLEIIGATSINEGDTETYTFRVTYTDASQSLVTVTDLASDNVVAVVSGNDVTIGSTIGDGTATLSASYTEDGVTVSDTHDINYVAAPVPQSLEIQGATSIGEGNTETYTYLVTMSDASTKTVTVDDLASDLPAGEVSGNNVTAGSIATDTAIELSASYTEDGVTVNDVHAVNLVANPAPQSLAIIGATSITEGDTESYTFRVTYTDNSTLDVSVADFASDNVAGVVSGSDVNAGAVDSDTNIELSASYTEDGVTVSDTHSVSIVAKPHPTALAIIGADSMNEQNFETYTFEVTMSDASTKTVSVTDFASDDTGKATVQNNNRVNSLDVGTDTTVGVTASYTEEGQTVNGSKTINIVADVVPASMEIIGASSVDEESTTSYSFRITMTDASTKDVTATVASTDKGTFNTAGQYVAPTVTGPDVAVLTASYTESGVTVDDTHNVNIGNTINPLVSIALSGPNTVVENGATGALTVMATFEDNSTSNVTSSATYVIVSGGSHGSLSGSTFTSNAVTADRVVTIRATYEIGGVSKTSDHNLTVENVPPVPVSVEISGLSEVEEGNNINLTATVTYNDASTAIVSASGTWDFVGNNAGASLGATGILNAPADVGSDTAITVRFTFTAEGATVTDTHPVNIKDIPVSSLQAAWGYDASGADVWPYTQAFIEALPNKIALPVLGKTLSLGPTSGHFYIAIPESELSSGKALHYHYNGSAQFSIWGGAKWPSLGFFGSTQPAIINIGGNNWHIYRTDLAGLGGPDNYDLVESNMPAS